MRNASNYTQHLQEFIRQFREEVGDRPVTVREVAAWAIHHHLWQPPMRSAVDQLAKELSRAARCDYFTDPSGRRVRRMHARKMDVQLPSGEWIQETFWDDITTALPEHLHKAFQQRRRIILSDCHQLKTDVDSYNENWNPGNPIQMSWDFEDDLAEIDLPTDYPESSGDDWEDDDDDGGSGVPA
jgi:hypothetical protein